MSTPRRAADRFWSAAGPCRLGWTRLECHEKAPGDWAPQKLRQALAFWSAAVPCRFGLCTPMAHVRKLRGNLNPIYSFDRVPVALEPHALLTSVSCHIILPP